MLFTQLNTLKYQNNNKELNEWKTLKNTNNKNQSEIPEKKSFKQFEFP